MALAIENRTYLGLQRVGKDVSLDVRFHFQNDALTFDATLNIPTYGDVIGNNPAKH
jgi:hypothetical protein